MKKGTKRVTLLVSAMLLVGAPSMYAASSSIVKGTILAYNYVVGNVTSKSAASLAKPITVNGRTYLPIDMVKEGTKVNVTVDAKTKSVRFGEKNAKVSLDKVKPTYDEFHSSNAAEHVMISNKNYEKVLVGTSGRSSQAIHFSPQNGYQTLHLEVAAYDDMEKEDSSDKMIREYAFTIVDSDTDQDLGSLQVSANKGVNSLDINVTGSKNITIKTSYTGWYKPDAAIILPTSYFK